MANLPDEIAWGGGGEKSDGSGLVWFLQKFTEQNQPNGQRRNGGRGAAVLGGEKKFRVESLDDDLLLEVGNGFRKRSRALELNLLGLKVPLLHY